MPDDGNGDLDSEAVAELRRLARSRPRSGREAAAKASALRTLERLRRGKRQVPPMPEGWYPQEPGDPFYGLEFISAQSEQLLYMLASGMCRREVANRL